MFRRLRFWTSPNYDGHPDSKTLAALKAQMVVRRAGFEVSSFDVQQKNMGGTQQIMCLSIHLSIHPSIGLLVSKFMGASASGLFRICGLSRPGHGTSDHLEVSFFESLRVGSWLFTTIFSQLCIMYTASLIQISKQFLPA